LKSTKAWQCLIPNKLIEKKNQVSRLKDHQKMQASSDRERILILLKGERRGGDGGIFQSI